MMEYNHQREVGISCLLENYSCYDTIQHKHPLNLSKHLVHPNIHQYRLNDNEKSIPTIACSFIRQLGENFEMALTSLIYIKSYIMIITLKCLNQYASTSTGLVAI